MRGARVEGIGNGTVDGVERILADHLCSLARRRAGWRRTAWGPDHDAELVGRPRIVLERVVAAERTNVRAVVIQDVVALWERFALFESIGKAAIYFC